MSPLKLEGDLNDISEQQQNFIIKTLDDLGYKGKATVEVLGKVGDNFSAAVKRITVDSDSHKPVKLIVKLAPQDEAARHMMKTTLTFQNEVLMYEELFPKFSQLEKQFGIPEEERFVYPACYGAFKQVPHEVLLLEDMTEYGYRTKDKMVPLDVDTIQLILKSFAHYHSLSYAFKNESLEVYNTIKERLRHVWAEMSNLKELFEPIDEQFLPMLDSDIAKQKCKGIFVGLPQGRLLLDELEKNGKESVIIQGDGWTNNFLFKTEEGKQTTCVMIDYQLSGLSSPASDLLYMIFTCTDYEARKENFHDWIDYYYTELEKALSKFGLKIQSQLPRDKFQNDIKSYGKYGMTQSLLTVIVTMREASEAKDMKSELQNKSLGEMVESMDLVHLKKETVERIVTRVRGTVASAIEYGLL